MFVGRHEELNTLEKLYAKNTFQLVVMYGRRRVGKTTLIHHFAADKPAIVFMAQEANDKMNLELFSIQVYRFFGLPESVGAFVDWNAAFQFLSEKAEKNRFILVIDEFPYAAEENRSLKSILQNFIDHKFKHTGIFIILCGSHMSFMENEVMGYKSPLYGRRTAQMKIKGFDYLDASQLLQGYSLEEVISFYSAFGGTPHYLSQIDHNLSFEENLKALYFDISGYLYDEPMKLLQQELRDPALYNTIITSVATGSSRLNEISTRTGEERSKINKYLQTLVALQIIKKEIPFGENPATSRKGIYKIEDNCYAFWYRYVFPNKSAIEQGIGNYIADSEVLPEISAYIGTAFETICMQYLIRKNRSGELPFVFTEHGRWWGTDKQSKSQVEIGLVASNSREGKILFGECKWRNQLDDVAQIHRLMEKSKLFSDAYGKKFYILFSKTAFSSEAKKMAKANKELILVDLPMLFE